MINKQDNIPFLTTAQLCALNIDGKIESILKGLSNMKYCSQAIFFFSVALHFYSTPFSFLLFILDSSLCSDFIDVKNAINTFIKPGCQ